MMSTETTIEIEVNGDVKRVPDGTTLADLLKDLRVEQQPVAVELNRTVLKSSGFERLLRAGDRLEIVTFVGGG